MPIFVLKRVLMSIPTFVIVAVIIFALVRALPGDPALMMLGGNIDDEATLEQMRSQLGLDQPMPVQFIVWLREVFSGNLGTSIMTGQEVGSLLWQRFGVTATVVLLAMGSALLVSIPAGLLAAHRHNSRTDYAIVFLTILKLSMPSFWVGLMLLVLFGAILGWLPTVGFVSISDDLGRGMLYLILPVTSLALSEIAVLTRMMRAGSLEIMGRDYITHARAKGLPERKVLWRHVFPNAFAPTLTMVGVMLAGLLAGAAVTETVFTLPGLGKLLVDSIYARDYPVLQGALLFIAAVYVLTNLLVDIAYSFFDPRVRLS
ncbi:ABC transporter permease [Nitratireductor aquibiodomus]|uniref:Peptide/nickel transport system permease protein n=1 Tax=Nitratireductor aquibiodomus TaxID=204799 RepID=A0A1H4LQH6_9HYPH|nr:ABC transporter permease [Nitratireductor aquibiodomus]SEB72980.1 peptide/nickel transport system permease protein [Nitratireductor aquibiodomus]